MATRRVELAWGGYLDGRLHRFHVGAGCGPDAAIFRTRAGARLEYEDVRRVEIRQVPPQKRKAKP